MITPQMARPLYTGQQQHAPVGAVKPSALSLQAFPRSRPVTLQDFVDDEMDQQLTTRPSYPRQQHFPVSTVIVGTLSQQTRPRSQPVHLQDFVDDEMDQQLTTRPSYPRQQHFPVSTVIVGTLSQQTRPRSQPVHLQDIMDEEMGQQLLYEKQVRKVSFSSLTIGTLKVLGLLLWVGFFLGGGFDPSIHAGFKTCDVFMPFVSTTLQHPVTSKVHSALWPLPLQIHR